MVTVDSGGGGTSPKKKKPKAVNTGKVHGPYPSSSVRPEAAPAPSYMPNQNKIPRGKPRFTAKSVFDLPSLNTSSVDLSSPALGKKHKPAPAAPKPALNFDLADSIGDYVTPLEQARYNVQNPQPPAVDLSSLALGKKHRQAAPRDINNLLDGPVTNSDGFAIGTPKTTNTDGIADWIDRALAKPKPEPGFIPGVPKNKQGYPHYWSKKGILEELSYATSDADTEWKMNNILDNQFADREQYEFNRTEEQATKIADALEAAGNAAYDGDFEYLRKVMEGGDLTSLDVPKFREVYGIGPKSMRDQRREFMAGRNVEDLSDVEKPILIRMDNYIKHLTKVRKSYRVSNDRVNKALEKYETKYNKAIDTGLDWKGEGADERRKAAKAGKGKAIPDLTPPTPAEEQEALDEASAYGAWPNPDNLKGVYAQRAERQYGKARARQILGIDKLPSVREMLALKAAEGNLDPDNEMELKEWITRFKNPNHPDTRLAYAQFAMQKNDDLNKQAIVDYMNEPLILMAEDQKKKAAEEGEERNHGLWSAAQKSIPIIGSYLSVFDDEETGRSGLERLADAQYVKGEGFQETEGAGSSALGWTFDKLSRLNYATAGFVDAVYGIDKDQGAWHDPAGPLGKAVSVWWEPWTLLTGQSAFDSLDEMAADPSKIATPFQEGYKQLFRGSDTLGVRDDIVPVTFANVIANAAEHNESDNLYDQEWYQHVMGFALDVTADPLNAIGVGFVDDILKVPAKIAKLSAKAEAGTASPRDLKKLSALQTKWEKAVARDPRATGQEVMRRNAALDAGDTLPYEGKDIIDTTADDVINDVLPVGADPFSKAASEVKIRQKQVASDSGQRSLQESLSESTIVPPQAAVGLSLRVNKMVAELQNFGYQYVKTLESLATSKGYLDNIIPKKGAEYEPYRIAQQRLNAAIKAGDEVEIAKQEEIIERGIADESLPKMFRKANSLRYLENKGVLPAGRESAHKSMRVGALFDDDFPMPHEGSEVPSLRSQYAKSAGMKEEDFPFDETQIAMSLVEGPKFARKADPTFAARQKMYAQRLATYRKTRKRIDDAHGGKAPESAHRNNEANKKQVLRQQQYDLYGASLRWLDAFATLRKEGALYSDAAKADALKAARASARKNKKQIGPVGHEEVTAYDQAKIDNPNLVPEDEFGRVDVEHAKSRILAEQAAEKEADAATVGKKSTTPDESRIEQDDQILPNAFEKYSSLTDEDLLDPTHPVFTDPENWSGLNDPSMHAEQLDRAFDRALKGLRLDKGGRITGLPPAQAYDIAQHIPNIFKNPNGSINYDKLFKSFVMRDQDWGKAQRPPIPWDSPKIDNTWHYVGPKEHAPFFEAVRGAIDEVYALMYPKVSDEYKAAKEAAGGEALPPPITTRQDELTRDFEAGEITQKGKPIKPNKHSFNQNSEWAKYNPQGFKSKNDLIQNLKHFDTPEEGVEKWYRALFAAGSPLRFKGAIRVPINDSKGKLVFPDRDYPSAVRKWYMKTVYGKDGSPKQPLTALERMDVDDYMRSVAEATFFHYYDTSARAMDWKQLDGQVRQFAGERIKDPIKRKEVVNRLLTRFKGMNSPYKPEDVERVLLRAGEGLRRRGMGYSWDPEIRALVKDIRFMMQSIRKDQHSTKLTGEINKMWDATIKASTESYESALRRAKADDAKQTENRAVGRAKSSGKDWDQMREMADIRRTARDRSKQVVLGEIVQHQTLKRSTFNERLTINEAAKKAEKDVRDEIRYRKNEVAIEKTMAQTPEELKTLEAKDKALDAEKAEALKQIEEARVEAQETRVMTEKRLREENIFQLSTLPDTVSTRALQLRIAGMKINLADSNSMFSAMYMLEKAIPGLTTSKFANYWVRPTKQLSLHESIHFRAMWESKTPAVIKAHLSRLAGRMRNITDANRVAMFDDFRRGRTYAGAQSEEFGKVAAELAEIEQIFKGLNPFYTFKGIDGTVKHLHWEDINHFLPSDSMMDTDYLYKALSKKSKDDKYLSLDDVYEAIRVRNPKAEINDPYRFSWMMRQAADQAAQRRAILNLMRETFGIKRVGKRGPLPSGGFGFIPDKYSDRGKIIEKFKDEGWETIEDHGMGGSHYFPPEAVKDIRKLLDFMDPKSPNRAFGLKQLDTILGIWKQGATIYNPGYYTRNGVGEIISSWLAGVDDPRVYRDAHRVLRYRKKSGNDIADFFDKWGVGEITPVGGESKNAVLFKRTKGRGETVTLEDILKGYMDYGMMSTFANTDIGQGLRGLSGSGTTNSRIRKGARKTNEKVHEIGEGFEDWLRMAHFIDVVKKSKAHTLDGAFDEAARQVTKYHFDYTDFSQFEKSWMLRAFPFYKWTRRGAPLMLAQLFMTPGKMVALPKAMDTLSGLGFNPVAGFTDDPLFSTQDVHDDKNGHLPDYRGIAPAWVRDLFAYQMNPAPDDEYANYARIQTPMIDGLNLFNQMAADPDPRTWGTATGLLNPFLKGGIESLSNHSIDPTFEGEIRGGYYNEANGLNPLESTIIHASRTLNPITGFLAKLSKNGAFGDTPLSMGNGTYRNQHGYDDAYDVASFASGVGFYQGIPKAAPEQEVDDGKPLGYRDEINTPPVGAIQGITEGPLPPGASPAPGSSDANDPLKNLLMGSKGSYGSSGSGWKNFGYGGGWQNFGYGGGYGGYGGGSGSSGFDLMAFLKQLAGQIDQGQVYDEGDMQ